MPVLSWLDLQDALTAAVQKGFRPALGQAGFRTFLETGTGLGGTCIPLAEHFEEVHTIELKEEFVLIARSRGWQAPRPIHFYHGASEDVLSQLLPSLRGPVVIFLDAHYSGDDTGRGDVDVPLLKELQDIVSLVHDAALILIDDLRLFGRGGPQGDLDVNWSAISSEAVMACLPRDRLACAFPLEAQDRFIVGLRSCTGRGPTVASKPIGDQTWTSTPGTMDMEALGALMEREGEYGNVARQISQLFSMQRSRPVAPMQGVLAPLRMPQLR